MKTSRLNRSCTQSCTTHTSRNVTKIFTTATVMITMNLLFFMILESMAFISKSPCTIERFRTSTAVRRTKDTKHSFCPGAKYDRDRFPVYSQQQQEIECKSQEKMIDGQNINEENCNGDDDDDILYNDLIYPPRSTLFDHTNVISKSIQFPSFKSNSSSSSFFYSILPHSNADEDNGTSIVGTGISSSIQSFIPKFLFYNVKQEEHNESSIGRIGVDVSIEFTNARVGAKELIYQCRSQKQQPQHPRQHQEDDNDELELLNYFTHILSYYQSVAYSDASTNGKSTNQVNTKNNNNMPCKARIVSSCGTKGIKCPRWHLDHVPVRLVMSLLGPGCIYLPHEIEMRQKKEQQQPQQQKHEHANNNKSINVNRYALNNIEFDDTEKANSVIMPNDAENILAVKANEGDAVLLMGRAWEKMSHVNNNLQQKKKQHNNNDNVEEDKNCSCCEGESSSSNISDIQVAAVPHRSPELMTNQMRVLLTVDIVPKICLIND